ncbi:MAG: hypothetical protein JSV25_08135 [Spirochaetota bacterium]|nr:MAG: hypothetical protein JSV25_08135 [Spirochaetota bacterium]
MEKLSDLDKIRFYREEVKHEFNLLAMRSTILITCQSFLILPFAIFNAAGNFRAQLIPVYLVTVLGAFVALILRRPITAAHHTIEKWLLKQRNLLQTSAGLKDLMIDRDTIPGVEKNINKDRDHIKSLAFTIYGPWVFCLFWFAAVVWSTIRVLLGF